MALIESLEESKRVATEISEKVVEARETEGAINESRNKYRTVAERGAMLFFLLNSLNKIHAFYQYSLNAFVSVFLRGLDLAPGGPKKKEHVTLRQLQKRLSGNAGDFDEVIKKAKRQSSNAGGKRSKRTTAQSGHMGPGKHGCVCLLPLVFTSVWAVAACSYNRTRLKQTTGHALSVAR